MKEYLEEGHTVQCFETTQCIGGAFAGVGTTASTRIYDEMHLTISNYYMAFSDFPPRDEWRFWTGQEYGRYLEEYAQAFDLRRHIMFSHSCLRVERVETNSWNVTVLNIAENIEETLEFDAVAVCVGAHRLAKKPPIQDEHLFRGQVIHSSHYVNATSFAGKRVVCVGLGESGADIVREISSVSEECHLVVHQYPFCLPRLLPDGHPADALTSRLFYPQRDDSFFLWLFVLLVYLVIWLPLTLTRWGIRYTCWRGQTGPSVLSSFDSSPGSNVCGGGLNVNTY